MSTLSTNQIVVEYVVKKESVQQIKGDFDRLTEAEKKSVSETKKLSDQIKEVGTKGTPAIKTASNEVSNLAGMAQKAVPALVAFFAIDRVIAFGKQVVRITSDFQQYQKAIDFAAGSQEKGQESMDFLRATAKKFGLDLQSLIVGYKSFAASSTLAGTSLSETNRQFAAISKGAATLGLSGERTKLILEGLAQISSKGTVSMEELRQQIGDSLPGALGIAARSMKMTVAEFTKLVSSGEVASKDFLPKFATELEKTFGQSAAQNVNTLTASTNRLTSAYEALVVKIGEGKLGQLIQREINIWAGYMETISDLFTDSATLNERKNQKILDNIRENARIEVGVVKKKYNEINNARATDGAVAQMLLNKDKEAYDKLTEAVRIYKVTASGNPADIKTLENVNERRKVLLQIIKDSIEPQIKFYKITKEDYEAKLKLLDVEERIALIRAKIKNENKIDLLREELKVRQNFGNQKIALDKEAEKAGIEGAKEAGRIRRAELELTKVETTRTLKKITQDYKESISEQIAENSKFEQKRGEDQRKAIDDKKKLNAELVKLEEQKADAIKDIDEKSAKEKKKLSDDLKEISRYEAQIQIAGINAVGDVAQGFFNLYQQGLSNELASLQKSFSEKIRLAGDNKQKQTELSEQLAAEEKAIKIKQFKASQQQAIANAVFTAAPYIIEYTAGLPITAANLGITLAALAAQTGFILAQPIPEFAKGTKGKAFKGQAIVGEQGRELVIGESGKMYLTPDRPSLVDIKERSQIIPNLVTEKYLGSMISNSSHRPKSESYAVVQKLISIENTLLGLPITQLSMNERGFEKYIRTPKRTTKVLNNRHGN